VHNINIDNADDTTFLQQRFMVEPRDQDFVTVAVQNRRPTQGEILVRKSPRPVTPQEIGNSCLS